MKKARVARQQRILHNVIRAARGMAALFLLFIVADCFSPVDTGIAYSRSVRADDGSLLYTTLTPDGQWRMNARLDEITPELRTALVAKEDKHFYHHPGINPAAVCRAAWNNLTKGRRTSGASTLTMQVTRMLHPRRRTLGAKLIESFRALQLEWHHSKDEILQLYLNLAPYGSNIQGVKAAALVYFGKSPDQLSLAEITALSIIPNRPASMVMGRDNDRIVQARAKWLRRYADEGLFAPAIVHDALAEPLNATRQSLPRKAPHFVLRMLRAQSGSDEIRTTLSPQMQASVESITTQYTASLRWSGIYNAAVLVVDNQTMEVKAYLGSPEFGDRLHAGEVDGVRAIRSPGSALKPLVYGLAFDRGLATPKTVLEDVPADIAGYRPENYDRTFSGPVTAEDALRQSLNIPAVRLLQGCGMDAFTESLASAGFRSMTQQKQRLGLSAILGGCGVRLEEMVGLYAAFANEGEYRPLRWTAGPARDSAVRILSLQAAWMLTGILRELRRPDLPHGIDAVARVPQIAWKTGTSYGRRDAWSIGYNPRFTIGVWVGNFSGRGAPDLQGAATATPLLFRIFEAMDGDRAVVWPVAPRGVVHRKVCAVSGQLPEAFCGEVTDDWAIDGVSSSLPCRHVRKAWVAHDASCTYCVACLPEHGYREEKYQSVSPALARWCASNGRSFERIPPHYALCPKLGDGTGPRILSLREGAMYLLPDSAAKLPLRCEAETGVEAVYWYVNDQLVGSSAPDEGVFIVPDAARLKVTCTDDAGRSRSVMVRVKRG
jgi:penicillin-binding protein 1C